MIGKTFNKDLVAPVYITVLTVIALVYGFTIVPSPQTERNRSFDHKRVSDLGNIKTSIDNYYNDNGNLPPSLSVLKSDDSEGIKLYKTDPQTKQQYGYSITGPETYKVCATFLTDSSKDDANSYDDNAPDYTTYMDDFKHSVGYHCFEENENGDTYDSPAPTMDCVGADCSSTNAQIDPSVTISSFDNSGNCAWTPKFHMENFSPDSIITATANVTLSNACSQKPNQQITEAVQLSQSTDTNGNLTTSYPNQLSYGDYNFTFTDEDGNSSSLHFVYEPPATAPTIIYPTPTPIPPGASGGGAGL